MHRTVRYMHYPRDNFMNPGGDYAFLVRVAERADAASPSKVEWYLTNNSPPFQKKLLTDFEVQNSLEFLFIRASKDMFAEQSL